MNVWHHWLRRLSILTLLCLPAISFAQFSQPAVDADAIEGVRCASLDQPRIYLNVRRTAAGEVLKTTDEESLSGIEAFLDTGASGIMLSSDTVKRVAIKSASHNGRAIVFEDVGVAGAEEFGVTEPLFVALGEYPRFDPETAEYSAPIGPISMQIKSGGGILELIAPGLDVAGMPVMVGKVVVLDPKPLADFDKIKTLVVPPGDPRIPKTTRHVKLNGVSFAKYTRVQPQGAAGPNLAANPMIGPDAINPAHKPVTLHHNGKTATATFLLDTGAAASLISTKTAENLGVKGVNGATAGVAADQQFQLAIGGLGGAKTAYGLYFDRMEIPTIEGRPITFVKAPLLVSDITVVDAEGKEFTLDGVLGMNFLVASAEITGGLLPDIGEIVDGPFRWVVIDFKQGILGLEPR